MQDDLERLLDFDRRRYWLENGWSWQVRAWRTEVSSFRPHGIRYALTLHDEGGERIMGFDNAHAPEPGHEPHDHRHLLFDTRRIVPYRYKDADTLIADFNDAVIAACDQVGADPIVVMEDMVP